MNSLGYITAGLTFISSYSGFEKASKYKAFVYAWIMISYLLIGFDIGFFLCLSSVEAAKYSLALHEYILLGRIIWNGISGSVGMIYIQTIEKVARKYQSVVLKSQITELEDQYQTYVKLQEKDWNTIQGCYSGLETSKVRFKLLRYRESRVNFEILAHVSRYVDFKQDVDLKQNNFYYVIITYIWKWFLLCINCSNVTIYWAKCLVIVILKVLPTSFFRYKSEEKSTKLPIPRMKLSRTYPSFSVQVI